MYKMQLYDNATVTEYGGAMSSGSSPKNRSKIKIKVQFLWCAWCHRGVTKISVSHKPCDLAVILYHPSGPVFPLMKWQNPSCHLSRQTAKSELVHHFQYKRQNILPLFTFIGKHKLPQKSKSHQCFFGAREKIRRRNKKKNKKKHFEVAKRFRKVLPS